MLEKDAEEIDVQELRLKIKGLEQDVSDILANFDKNDPKSRADMKKQISNESLSLIQTLLLLVN
jgi:MerR family transcriptional regulator, copper efflux regulator